MARYYLTFRCPECYTGRKTEAGMDEHRAKCKVVRCPECRTRFTTVKALLDHLKVSRHKSCDCGHGHHFPHRPGTNGCQSAPWDDLLNMPKGIATRGSPPPF